MLHEELNKIANHWFDAFNRKDIEALLSLYDDHAQHYSPRLKAAHPETKGLITGKPAMRQWWQDAFDRLPSLHYQIVRLTPFEDRIFMEYVRQVEGDADLYVGELLEVCNGKIVKSRVFNS